MRRPNLCGLTMCLSILVFAGCGDDEIIESDGGGGMGSDGGMGGDGGMGDGGMGDGGMGGAAVCNEIDISPAPVVPFIQVAEDPPTAMGGEIQMVPNPNHLTSVTIYTGVGGETGPTGKTRQEVTQCGGSVCNVVYEETPQPLVHFSWDLDFVGTDMIFTETCGGGLSTFTLPYTADSSSFTLLIGNIAYTYTPLDE